MEQQNNSYRKGKYNMRSSRLNQQQMTDLEAKNKLNACSSKKLRKVNNVKTKAQYEHNYLNDKKKNGPIGLKYLNKTPTYSAYTDASCYKFDDLISENFYKKVNSYSIHTSLETIKKMDDYLWDDVRYIYEKLNKNKEVTFTEIYVLVTKLIRTIYGAPKISSILKIYHENINIAVLEVGKYLLNTYHEAYEIVNEHDYESDRLYSSKKSPISESACTNTSDFPPQIEESECSSVEIKCKPIERLNGGTVKTKITDTKKMKTICTTTNENCFDETSNSTESECILNRIITKDEQQIRKRSDFSADYHTIDKEINIKLNETSEEINENKRINKGERIKSLNREVNTERSTEIVSLLRKTKINKKKARSNLTISIQDKKIGNVIEMNKKETDLVSGTFLENCYSWLSCLPSVMKKCVPNLMVLLCFAMYKYNAFELNTILFALSSWFKIKLRSFLMGVMTLLDN